MLIGECIFIFFTFKYKEKVKQLFIAGIILLNIVLGIYYYTPFYLIYGTSFNLGSLLATSQTAYTADNVESEVLLPLIIRGKSVYVSNEGDYRKYIGFFSEEVFTLENENRVYDYTQLKSEFMDFGEIQPNALDFYYEGKNEEFWEKLYENKAHIYISSNEVIDEKKLIALNDEDMNLYVMSFKEYQERYK